MSGRGGGLLDGPDDLGRVASMEENIGFIEGVYFMHQRIEGNYTSEFSPL